MYITGINRLNPSNRHPAILEWSADNRIRLFVGEAASSQTVVLDCAPTDIKRFSTAVGVANLILMTGQRFTLEFSLAAGNEIIGGVVMSQFGPGGMAVATALDQHATEIEAATDIEWWTQTLTRFGVGGLRTSAKTFYKINKVGWWIMGGILGFTLLLALVGLVLYLLDAAGIA